MAYIKGEPLKELRKKIIKIAASYVGQTSISGQNSAKNDPIFDKKLRGVGWSAAAWCNWTVLLIYKEALIGGNMLVDGIGDSDRNFENKRRYIPLPVDSSKSGKIISSPTKGYYRNDYSLQTPHTTATRSNFQKFNRFISINEDGGLGRKGSPSKFKKYAEGGYILPGDSVLFDWAGTNPRTEDHIGIYVAPANSSYTKAICIEGNTSATGKPNGVYLKVRNVPNIMGFNQLVLRENI
tara:strand:+ start:6267 stop:6980 length:714 start_codon:yes stop_codon:yes gene_type:complete